MAALSHQSRCRSSLAAVLLLLLVCCQLGHCKRGGETADSWCQAASALHWSQPLQVSGQTVLGKQDVYSCTVLDAHTAAAGAAAGAAVDARRNSAVTQVGLQVQPAATSKAAAGAQLRQLLLLDCDPGLWQLGSIQGSEAACITSTSVLRAACNQWSITVPADGHTSSQSCAPQRTAFATPDSLRGRVLVLQAHWHLPDALLNEAVTLPSLQLALGSTAAVDASSPKAPALLGTFVGSGIYPPSGLSQNLQAFELPAPAAGAAVATAELACSKRCTYVPLGKLSPKPVNVVGYSFATFDRATQVSFEIQRGKWGRSAGHIHVTTAPGQGVVALQQPFQLHAGDIVRWRCSYNMSSVKAGSSLKGGYSSSQDAQEEQCTVMLHYWPRVESLRGCSAALDSDKLLGENMCSAEAQDLIKIMGMEAQQFPMRRMYQEHSFPPAAWMGGWKATHIILQMAVVWACLWGFQTLLSRCKALGPIHRRFISLHAGQQRNVSLYLTHLVLDTVALAYVFQPMIELWFGLTETVAEVQPGVWGFTYLVACYMLELTWRRSIDTMLAIHHIGTISIILLYAGELTASTYRVANNIIVLAAFALMEQPTYVALLLKRMMPSHSQHVVRAARIGYLSWFVLKGASVLLAVSMFVEDWHLMPTWIRVNFTLTWVVAALVQGWSGFIQRGIYRHIARAHKKSRWEHRQEQLKRQAAAALAIHAVSCTSASSSDEETEGGGATPPSSHNSHGDLDAPLLRPRRIVAMTPASTDSGSGSPFERIATEVAEAEEVDAAAAVTGGQGLRAGSDRSCAASDGEKGWPGARWLNNGTSSSLGSDGRLSGSSSLADGAPPAGSRPASSPPAGAGHHPGRLELKNE